MTLAPAKEVDRADVIHSLAASLHTPESFGRALIAQAIKASAANDMDGTEMPVTINVRPVGGALRDSQPVCIDVCAGIFGAEICIHVEIPATLVDLF